jgi:prolyl 4-hydroxylase
MMEAPPVNNIGTAATANALAEAGRYDEAVTLLMRAASAGEAQAQFALAMWRISGAIVRRDLAAARDLLGRAAASGHVEAAHAYTCFLAAGTGGPPDWASAVRQIDILGAADARAAAQLRVMSTLDLDHQGLPRSGILSEPLAESPRASVARGFATAAECQYLLERAEPEFTPSVVVDPSGKLVAHPVRNSDGAFFGVIQEDLVINALTRRIAALSGTSLAQGEPLQVLRYRPGMEYKPHLDALPAEPNQRILTALVYLTDDYEGGETRFVTGLSFRGRQGDALLFSNVLPHGAPDPASQHAGLPVRRGMKAVASRWIRARPFAFPPPVPVTGNRYG